MPSAAFDGSQGCILAEPSQHLHNLRNRRGRWASLHCHGTAGGADTSAPDRGKPLEIEAVLDLGIQIADALDAAHAKGSSSRHQAREHLRHESRPREDFGFRTGEGLAQAGNCCHERSDHRIRGTSHQSGHNARHGGVYVARAGSRRRNSILGPICSPLARCCMRCAPERSHSEATLRRRSQLDS